MDKGKSYLQRVRNELAAHIETMINANLFSREIITFMMEAALVKMMPDELDRIADEAGIPASERAAFREMMLEECRALILQVKEGKAPQATLN